MKKTALFFNLLIVMLNFTLGRNPNIGSPKPHGDDFSFDTTVINLIIKKGWQIASSSPKTAVKLANTALMESKRIYWLRGQAESLLLLGKSYDYLGDYKKALQIDIQALAKSKIIKNEILIARSLRQVGGMNQALGNYPLAISFFKKSYDVSKKNNYLKGMASSLSDLGVVYRMKSEYQKALKYFFESIAIKVKIKDLKNTATSYGFIGNIYTILGDINLGIDYHYKGLVIRESIKDSFGLSLSYSALAELSILIKDYKKARYYSEKSLVVSKRLGFKNSISAIFNKLGVICENENKYDSALIFHKMALNLHTESSEQPLLADDYSNIGNILRIFQKYDSATFYLQKSLVIDLKLKNSEAEIDDYIRLAHINYESGNIVKSKKYLKLAESKLVEQHSLNQSRDLAELQSQLFEKQGNYKASLTAYKRFITLRDSAINQNKKVAVALKEAKYEFDKKALADSLKNNEAQKAKDLQIKFKDSELQKQKLKQNAMLAGIVVLFVLGWLLYSRYKAVSLQQVSERKLMLLEKEQALVEERTRIADEMHDDVGADLSNLLLKIRMNEQIQTQSASPSVDLGGLKSSTNGIIHKIDEIIWSLNSHRDTLQELVNFIVKYYDTILKENNLSGKVDVQETLPALQLAAKQRRNIYLTVKEILNNVLKHAQAKSIQLDIRFESNLLQIKISDNGKGFEPEKVYQGNGLRNMRKRLEMMGGKLEIASQQNTGSSFLLHIPVG